MNAVVFSVCACMYVCMCKLACKRLATMTALFLYSFFTPRRFCRVYNAYLYLLSTDLYSLTFHFASFKVKFILCMPCLKPSAQLR